jgi:ribosomal protein S12 methylthiotransferase
VTPRNSVPNARPRPAITLGLVSLGCPKNLIDSEKALAALEARGARFTEDLAAAQAVIVNTCGFIDDAKEESIDAVLEVAGLRRRGRLKHLVVAGCLSQRYGAELGRELPEADLIVGLLDGNAASLIAEFLGLPSAERLVRPAAAPTLERHLLTPPHTAYLRVAEGCDNRCAYCAIPDIRGPLRSRPMNAILAEARALSAAGAVELNIVGEDTTAYGSDAGGPSRTPELLRKLNAVEGIRWIRVLYTHPAHYTDDFIEAVAGLEKVLPYLDIPIQHASTRVLRRMGRKVTRTGLERLIRRLRRAIPGLVLRSTAIVGFPGETREDFAVLESFLAEVRFERLGAFLYSPEEGTRAVRMKGRVRRDVARRRLDRLMRLQAEITFAWNKGRVGEVVESIIDDVPPTSGPPWAVGRTTADAPEVDGKVAVYDPERRLRAGDIVGVRVTGAAGYDLVGEPAV